MTALKEHIIDIINRQGPITVAHYMELALTHPELGYYTSGDPLGKDGDFTTSPEISQMFGELIGLFFADYWLGMGSPSPVHLIELGPGRGTLMADALRAVKVVPGLSNAIQVHFIEVSPPLMAAQKKAVPKAQWHDSLDDVPLGVSFIIANEVFDCLPIRQFVKADPGWDERMVDIEDDNFVFGIADVSGPPLPEGSYMPGDIKETSPQAAFWLGAIAQRIDMAGGLGLIIDYGYDQPGAGDTFQAVKNHETIDVLTEPGSSDLTAHVDFLGLSEKAENLGLVVYGPIGQGRFLENIGIEHRAGKLLDKANAKQKEEILAAVDRLVSPEQMGRLFKVLCLGSKNGPAPSSFGPPDPEVDE